MATEVWLRNPWNYIREVVEVGHCWLAWDRGVLVKRGNLDVNAFCNANIPTYYEYRNLLIGEQGAAEIDRTTSFRSPRAVYPVWDYSVDSFDKLVHLVESPVAEDPLKYGDPLKPPDARPVKGQPHRVVVVRPPDFNGSLEAKTFYPALRNLQEDHPECAIHLHGSYSLRAMFSFGFQSADCDPSEGRGGIINLPMGKKVRRDQVSKFRQWVTLLGCEVSELDKPRGVCMFNIRSCMWAGANWNSLTAFRTARDMTDRKVAIPRYTPGPAKTVQDKFLCDRCSLAVSCKYYREGAVCSLPDSESIELSRFFTTRDSDVIIGGLTRILGFQAERLEEGREAEKIVGELDPEVTRIADGLFEKALKLAKLVNPELDQRKPTVAVQVNSQGATQVNAGAPVNVQEMVGRAFSELEAKGFARETITIQMVEEHLRGGRVALPSGS